MFSKKNKPSNLEGVRHWTGIYEFDLPYIVDLVKNDEGIIKVYDCNVEMHIGGQENLDQGLIATVIISAKKGGVGITNFIEEITTLIQNGYIDKVVIPTYGPIHDRVRWIERNYYPEETFQTVSLKWNEGINSYEKPSWDNLSDDDWVLQKTKLLPYA